MHDHSDRAEGFEPPLEVQQQIVDECEAIDQTVINAQQAIQQPRNEIEENINQI
ncbi:MAG: hypothetical protein V7K38_08170 [Nostoc sp.]|uniref:hypothetical protein n=1 Tax=Nostoc sp. TaxID=1180 RepID=UPI002FF45EFC